MAWEVIDFTLFKKFAGFGAYSALREGFPVPASAFAAHWGTKAPGNCLHRRAFSTQLDRKRIETKVFLKILLKIHLNIQNVSV